MEFAGLTIGDSPQTLEDFRLDPLVPDGVSVGFPGEDLHPITAVVEEQEPAAIAGVGLDAERTRPVSPSKLVRRSVGGR